MQIPFKNLQPQPATHISVQIKNRELINQLPPINLFPNLELYERFGRDNQTADSTNFMYLHVHCLNLSADLSLTQIRPSFQPNLNFNYSKVKAY